MSMAAELIGLLRCPTCASRLDRIDGCDVCGPFLFSSGQPILVDFERSILDRDAFIAAEGSSPVPRHTSRIRSAIRRVLFGVNSAAERSAGRMLQDIGPTGRVLVIGGGSIGSGANRLYAAGRTIGTDIYASPNTCLVADGHNLPFVEASFDGVWIQAVLEHVLDPERVVSEIHRVLKPGGVVFSDTPFMQQVHEGAYDFSRFSLGGHRWLFRRFAVLEAGATAGAGTGLIWAWRYFWRALFRSDKAAWVLTLPFFWLRFFDGKGRWQEDAACGAYLYARKADAEITHADVIAFYKSR